MGMSEWVQSTYNLRDSYSFLVHFTSEGDHYYDIRRTNMFLFDIAFHSEL